MWTSRSFGLTCSQNFRSSNILALASQYFQRRRAAGRAHACGKGQGWSIDTRLLTHPPPPPPVEVPAQFFGYASMPSSPRRLAFFLNGDDVIVVQEGSVFLSRFRLDKIGNDSADVEEVSSGRHATRSNGAAAARRSGSAAAKPMKAPTHFRSNATPHRAPRGMESARSQAFGRIRIRFLDGARH